MTSSGRHSIKVPNTTFGYSLVAVVTDLCRHLTYESSGAWHCMPGSSRNISKIIPEIHTVENFDFLKSVIHTQLI